MNALRIVLLAACLVSLAPAARAEPQPAQPQPARQRPSTQQAAAEIDALLEAHWKRVGVTRNEPASDEVFLRRVYLDLAGRIPTSAEAAAFLGSTRPDKQAVLIDDLLCRESYVSRFYNFWADILRYKSHYVNRANVIEAAYARFIKESLRTNKPYDRFVREMLSAKGYAWEDGAIGYYHRDPEMPLDNMAITARVFLGTRIECAQCHNHPFDKWKQTEFYRLAAFTYPNKPVNEAFQQFRAATKARERVIEADFAKEKAASADGGKAAAERKQARLADVRGRELINIVRGCVGQLFSPIGLVRDTGRVLKLPHDFKEKDGKPHEAIRPTTIMGPPAEVAPGQDPAEVFARWVTSPENPRFTKVIVNRLWKAMFGVALTEPLDDLRDDAKAMVPEVQDYLERLMVAQGYDMRAFLAVVANTRAYQSAACREEFASGGAFHFQGPALRRMTAEQIWDSVVALASHEPDARDLMREERELRRIAVSQMACDAYLEFGGDALLDIALARLEGERERAKREAAVREAQVAAKRAGDAARTRQLAHDLGDLSAERGRANVRDFIMPLLANLAKKKAGPDAAPVADPGYKMNANPNVLATETWKKMYVPGYGPAPRTPERVEAEARAERERLLALAAALGVAEADRAGFVAYCQRARAEWLRASELDSPAPRGHFLRTMGQSDRDFVENANPNPSIPQALLLMNGDVLTERNLLSPHSPLMMAVNRERTPEAKASAAYLAILSRRPTPAEVALWSDAAGRGMTIEDLVYALLNTKQFVFVR